MTTIEQITYQASTGSSGTIVQTAASFADQASCNRWWRRLEPWLRTGKPENRAYLNFGMEAAYLRWYAQPRSHYDWEFAHVLTGPVDLLTGTYALELVNPDPPTTYRPGAQEHLATTERGSGREAVEARARSAPAIEQLVPLLAHALHGERRVTMPWTAPLLPEAVMWGLINILQMTGDARPVSFLTYMSSPRAPDTPGLFIGFRPNPTTVVSPDPNFISLAETLATKFAEDPDELRELLAQHGTLELADHAGRISRLLDLLPVIKAGGARAEGMEVLNTGSVSPSRHKTAGEGVRCPMCLHEIKNWDSLDYWKWDPLAEAYVELPVHPGLDELQLNREVYGASVRCPSAQGEERIGAHYLPADYGRFGPPVVLGFVGMTKSGKSHLLASMVGAMVERKLARRHNISSTGLDHAWHRRFMETWVSPLKQGKVLPGTREGVVDFADAFLISGRGGPERVVALFDVAGGDLAKQDKTKEFLWIANGLFFVIDPDRMSGEWAEDETFGSVLDVIRKRRRNEAMSAAIVLNKADILRFDEPIDRWLRADDGGNGGRLDVTEFLRESADVYAFLDARDALTMAEPYEVCDKATMHVVSPTGGAESVHGVFPRGVTPRRVLRPLVAMLAMTGVLIGPDAEQVGV